MRFAKSYSIVDHQLLHGRYLHRLSHAALALYLFLVVVGDRDGKSFYAVPTIMNILRMEGASFSAAQKELIQAGLIMVRGRYMMVKNLERGTPKDRLPKRGRRALLPADRSRDGDLQKARFQAVLEHIRHTSA